MPEAGESQTELPRLLFLSDVSPELTGGGGIFMYRLLCAYPPERLMVVSYPTTDWPGPIHRIPGVTYHDIRYSVPRLIFNRFNPFWAVGMSRYIRLRTPEVLRLVRSFAPQAVMTGAHAYLWFVADAVARKLGVPLHVMMMDDWSYLQTGSSKPWVRPYAIKACLHAAAGPVLRRAATRFVASPGMGELYKRELGVDCDVLYALRAEDSPKAMVRTNGHATRPFAVAYAGLIYQPWCAKSLSDLATVLDGIGGKLDLYVPYDDAALAQMGLSRPNIRRVGFFPAREMGERVAASAHALFLPGSFEPSGRRDISTLFPSKLPDYTAVGVPILCWAPAYSSAARWVSEGPDRGELVTDPDPASLLAPLTRLANDPEHARRLAQGAVDAGIADFDTWGPRGKLYASLRRAASRDGTHR